MLLQIFMILCLIALLILIISVLTGNPELAFRKRKSRYLVLYEIRFECWLILGIAVLTCLVFAFFESLNMTHMQNLIVDVGILLAVGAELWIRVFGFWGCSGKYIAGKGVPFKGKIIQYDVMTHQKGRGADWKEYVPVIQLPDGEIIKSNSTYLKLFPPVQSECTDVFYKKRYFITEIF